MLARWLTPVYSFDEASQQYQLPWYRLSMYMQSFSNHHMAANIKPAPAIAAAARFGAAVGITPELEDEQPP